MSHPEGILDTSVVVALSSISDADKLPERPLISAVTLAELTVGPLVTDDLDERVRRQNVLQQAEVDFDPIPFDAAAARAFGHVAAELRGTGRKSKARAYDALIAATAISRQLPVYTMNPADFSNITDLDVVAVSVD